ncbi:MAG: hypothetical protein AB8B95_02275 [Pseudohongiellaceae bacterium]
MTDMRARAQKQFPIVLLTLISIIQALALELLWSKVMESRFLFNWDVSALVGWGMVSVSLAGILQIWVMYSTLVIGFTWKPSLRDSILPFVIGIQQFLMVTLISSTFNVMWLYVLASIFLVGNGIAHTTFRRARADVSNSSFFQGVEPATLKDFRMQLFVIVLLVFFGMAYTLFENSNWIAFLAIVFANGCLAMQIIFSRQLWASIMAIES